MEAAAPRLVRLRAHLDGGAARPRQGGPGPRPGAAHPRPIRAIFAVRALIRPALNDISTDIDDPPTFSRSRAALEARGGRIPPDVARGEARSSSATPIRRSRRSPSTSRRKQAFDLVRKAPPNRGWQIIEAARPGGRVGLGRIEAVDRTFLLRLPDDITVRIRPRADGARIDVRSASRIGQHDLGQNAQRIQRFLEEVSNLALALK